MMLSYLCGFVQIAISPKGKEKQATRARDALAAERRRLPMVRVDKDYVFEAAEYRLPLGRGVELAVD